MSIYKSAIQKPITTALIFVGIIVLGLFSLKQLPIDQLPKMEPPYVSVMTTYPGANASEIETNISKLLENVLNSVDGLKEIHSTSKDNISVVMLEFEWGVNLDEAVNDVRSSIDFVYDRLPSGASRPTIFKFNTSMMPIMGYAITAEESYPGLDKIIEDNVVNELNRIDGIGNISLTGAPQRYIYVDIDPKKIDAFGISIEQVGQAVAANNLNLASGTINMGKEHYQVRVEGEYKESSEINNIVVSTTPTGKQVYLCDIGTVRDTIKDITLDQKINGKDGATLMIMKQSGANTSQIARDVRKELAKIQKTLPPDITITPIFDSSSNIENAISGLSESILYALIFVVLVVLFFLGKWRATIIISLAIPISLVVSFIYLFLVGSSINIISLSSLTVAIGLVVDDAIVVLENIDKHINRGSSPREASIYATNEVWVSVIATTLVLVAVFVPLTMLKGMAGVLFKELGWIVAITVSTSAVVAITLTPMLSSRMLKMRDSLVDKANGTKRKFTYENTVVKFLGKVDAWYARVLRVCLNHRKITISAMVALFVASLIPVFMGLIGTDFMPQTDEGRLNISAELQHGTRVEETMKTARNIEAMIAKRVPELVVYSTTTGTNDKSGVSSLFSTTSNNKLSMTVRCTKKDERQRTIFEIAEDIRNGLKAMPEIINYTVSTAGGMGGANSNNVSVEIYGYDFDHTNALAAELKDRIKNIKGARDITVSREDDRAELQIVFDKQKLALHRLNEATAAAFVRNRINGYTAGYFKEDGKEYSIIVRLAEEHRNSISRIEELTINTPLGQQVKLKELAEIKEYWCPPNIEHKRRERQVTLSVTPVDVPLSVLAASIEGEIAKVDVPQGLMVHVGGAYEKQQESFADMGTLFLLIIMLVYIVMASQFESFSKPFIIMMSIPFAISGVILALLITGTSLNMVGALGVILLAGIVVKNGIVLVDYTNLMRDRGYELHEAIALSGQSRLRPVLMTAATTTLGMIPMALSTSEGSEIWAPMGIVVIGGLLVSTIVTLIIVPVLYSFLSRKGERNKEAKLRKAFKFLDQPAE